jgi:hypothetical protein
LVPHLGQVISDGATSGFPQFPQNFMVAGFSVLQFWQTILATGAKLAPQFPQNLVVAGFLAPQF